MISGTTAARGTERQQPRSLVAFSCIARGRARGHGPIAWWSSRDRVPVYRPLFVLAETSIVHLVTDDEVRELDPFAVAPGDRGMGWHAQGVEPALQFFGRSTFLTPETGRAKRHGSVARGRLSSQAVSVADNALGGAPRRSGGAPAGI